VDLKRSVGITLAIIILVSSGLLLLAARQKSFWYDEAYSAAAAGRGLSALPQVVAEDIHPPLLVYLLSAWGRLAGYDELGLRSLSILFAALALLTTFWLARDLLDERAALAGTAVLGLSPLFIMFAHNARYYALSASLTLIVVRAMFHHQAGGKLSQLWWYGLAAVALLYLLYPAAVVLLLCNLWWLGLWSRQRSPQRLKGWLVAQGLVIFAYLPGLFLLHQTIGRFSDSTLVPAWAFELASRLGYSAYVFAVGETLSPLNPLAWLGLALVAGLFLWAAFANRRRAGFWLAASFFAGIVLFNGVLSLNSAVSLTWQSLPLRAFYALPFLAICLGAGLAALRPRLALTAGVLLLLVFAVASWNYLVGRQHLRPMIAVPWTEIFTHIQSTAQPGSQVICGRGDYACAYYAGRYGFAPHSASEFSALSRAGLVEIWWIQTNLGSETAGDREEQDFLQAAMAGRLQVRVSNYAPQDATIRWLKSRFLGQEDYAYRVQVYRFSPP
jgi:uncharacterized membrane protein